MRKKFPMRLYVASIARHKNKWRVQLYVGGVRMSKVLPTEGAAKSWATHQESRLRKRAELKELLEIGEGLPNFPKRIVEAMQSAPLTYEEIVDGAITAEVFCGVYFLINAQRIVYVGQSTNVMRRISVHKDKGIEFDSFSVLPCRREDLDRVESMYITALYPERNRSLGVTC